MVAPYFGQVTSGADVAIGTQTLRMLSACQPAGTWARAASVAVASSTPSASMTRTSCVVGFVAMIVTSMRRA